MERISSRQNPLARRLRRLLEGGPEEGLMRLEGLTLVEEALAARVMLVEVAIAADLSRSARGQELLRQIEDQRVPIRLFDNRLLASLSALDTDQGLLAVARRPDFEEEQLFRGTPLLVVGVALQNPGNVGALLRVAEAAGATGAWFSAGSADPLSWKALRGSMGSAFRLPHLRGHAPETVLERLRARGVVNVASAARGVQPFEAIDWRRPSALWLGNEASGLEEGLLRLAEERATIPMSAPVESLNVSVAAGIMLFEAARQRRSF